MMKAKRLVLASGLAGAMVLGSAATALAVTAIATTSVNVRTGPGVRYAVVDVLRTGERVDVQGCRSGWCYVKKSGPDGWVYARYLARPVRPFFPIFRLWFNFGNPPPAPPMPPHGPGGPGGPGHP